MGSINAPLHPVVIMAEKNSREDKSSAAAIHLGMSKYFCDRLRLKSGSRFIRESCNSEDDIIAAAAKKGKRREKDSENKKEK